MQILTSIWTISNSHRIALGQYCDQQNLFNLKKVKYNQIYMVGVYFHRL